MVQANESSIESLESKLDFVSGKVREYEKYMAEESFEGVDLSPLKQIHTVERARSCIAALFEMVMNLRVEKVDFEEKILEFDSRVTELEKSSRILSESKKQQESYY